MGFGDENVNHPEEDEKPPDLSDFRTALARFSFSSVGASPTPSPSRRSPKKQIQPKHDDDEYALPNFSQDIAMGNGKGKRPLHDPEGEVEKTIRKQSPKKSKRGYAAPETYAHLYPLQDCLRENLDVMFCGINPGCMSAEIGHHFANPTNHFWRCLHRSGFTPSLLSPTEDYTLPESFCLGLTNIVERPSSEQAELSKIELTAGVPTFLRKVLRYRPAIVCLVGMGIWEIVEKAVLKMISGVAVKDNAVSATAQPSSPRGKSAKAKTSVGLQRYKLVHGVRNDESSIRETLFFVTPSTSGRVVSHQLDDKVELFRDLKGCLEDFKDGKIDTSKMVEIPLESETL